MSSEFELDEYYDFSTAQTVPNEVLFMVFELLELSDRLSVRLVCRRWYDVCRDGRFHIREKFSIVQLYKSYLSDVLEFFTSVDREYFNFEFNGLSFGNDSPRFWEICGPKIKSLLFVECELSSTTFSHIITRCTSLQKVTLCVWQQFGEQGNQINGLDLQAVVEGGNVNTNVQCVELHFLGLKHQWSRSLVQFFQLFPRIRRFTFFGSEYSWDYEEMNPANLTAINETLFSGRMEDLRFVTYQYQYRDVDWTVLATKSQLTMLTEVAVHMIDSTDKELLASFLGRQRNLEILHFLLRTTVKNAATEEAFDIIFNKCPKLNDLKLTCTGRLSWRSEWFELLAKSSIAALKIECDDIVFPEVKIYPENSTVRKLEVQFKSFFNTSTLPLIEAFSCLSELIIFKITDEIMSTILQQQKHLNILNVRFKTRLITEVALDRYRRSSLDFSGLSVERLSIPADLPKYSNFLSPRLKCLHLYPPMGEVFYNPILLNTKLSPLLEEVIIECSCFLYPFRGTFTENLLRFIHPLKKLRYLWITPRTRLVYSSDMPYLSDDSVRSMFQHCSTLTCFVYKRIYFRNNLDRENLTVAEVDEHLPRNTSTRILYKNIHLPSVKFSLRL